MSSDNITVNAGLSKAQSEVFAGLAKIDMNIKPYSEVKKFLDEKARETMYKLKAVADDVLSFEGDKDEQ